MSFFGDIGPLSTIVVGAYAAELSILLGGRQAWVTKRCGGEGRWVASAAEEP